MDLDVLNSICIRFISGKNLFKILWTEIILNTFRTFYEAPPESDIFPRSILVVFIVYLTNSFILQPLFCKFFHSATTVIQIISISHPYYENSFILQPLWCKLFHSATPII